MICGNQPRVVAWALWLIGLMAAVSSAGAQFDLPSGDQFGGPLGAGGVGEGIVQVSAQFTAPAGGQPGRLLITAAIKPDWHIYSITQAPGGPIATKIKLEPSSAFRLLGPFQAVPPPEKKKEPVFNNLVVESHSGRVTWHAPLELGAGVDPAALKIQGRLSAQACDPNSCLPPSEFPFTAVLGKGVDLSREVSAGGAAAFDPAALVIAEDEQLKQTSFTLALAFGFLGGLILNLMPCVLPVIGLKILSFVQQAGHNRWQALVLNIWYSLGLLSVFLGLASLSVTKELGWGQLFTDQRFSVTLAAVVFTMGLSFLGVWDVPIPGFVGRGKASELAEKEGAAGAFAKGVLTTILATPCSAPFLATALAWTVKQPPLNTYAVFASAGLGMASPYLLIGAFPQLLRCLPKPGAWMDTFKQLMGFVLLGTVVFVLSFMAFSYVVPTIALLFGLWGSCWWIGRTPPTAELGAKARAWLEAAAFAGLVWIISFPGIEGIAAGRFAFGGLHGIMKSRLEDVLDQEIAGRLSESKAGGGRKTASTVGRNSAGSDYQLPWQPFTRSGFEELTAAQKTVLVDFTANWCLTCKTLEQLVLNTPQTRKLVEANRVVTLRADWSDGAPEVTAMLELLGSKQVPVIAIFPGGNPNRPLLLRGGYTQQQLLAALEKAGPSKE